MYIKYKKIENEINLSNHPMIPNIHHFYLF